MDTVYTSPIYCRYGWYCFEIQRWNVHQKQTPPPQQQQQWHPVIIIGNFKSNNDKNTDNSNNATTRNTLYSKGKGPLPYVLKLDSFILMYPLLQPAVMFSDFWNGIEVARFLECGPRCQPLALVRSPEGFFRGPRGVATLSWCVSLFEGKTTRLSRSTCELHRSSCDVPMSRMFFTVPGWAQSLHLSWYKAQLWSNQGLRRFDVRPDPTPVIPDGLMQPTNWVFSKAVWSVWGKINPKHQKEQEQRKAVWWVMLVDTLWCRACATLPYWDYHIISYFEHSYTYVYKINQ